MEDTARLVAAAHGARSFVDYERAALSVVRAALGADVAFMVRADGLGAGALGVRPDVARACRGRWGVYGAELAGVLEAARAQEGVALDVEVLGDGLREQRVFRELMAPHGGRCTLIGTVAFGDEVLATIAAGYTASACRARARDRLVAWLPTLAVCEAAMRRRRETWATLTPREREVVRCLRLGFTNGEIAACLGTSVHTVRNQMRSVFRKLGATTRAEAVALSLGHGT